MCDEVLFFCPSIVLYGGVSKGITLPSILKYVCEKDSFKLMFRIIVIIINEDKNVMQYLFIILFYYNHYSNIYIFILSE